MQYKTETSETPTIFHINTILKKKNFSKEKIKTPKISAKKKSQKPKTQKFPFPQNQNLIKETLSP